LRIPVQVDHRFRPQADRFNLAGLQLADLVAHPSRNEILNENGHAMTIAPFAAKVIAVLQGKYDRRDGRVFGKKML